jgi:hypothetical protein
MKLSNKVLSAIGGVLATFGLWAGNEAWAVAADVKQKADRVPALEKQVDRTYDEIQVLRQQATEQLIVLHSALGNLERVAELKSELEKLKKEAEEARKKAAEKAESK